MALQFIYGHPVKTWIERQPNIQAHPRLEAALGVVRNGEIVAGIAYHTPANWEFGRGIWVDIAARPKTPWASRRVWRAAFDLGFNALGCTRIGAKIREGNVASEELCKRLGFRKEGVFRRAYNGKTNAIYYSMLRNECRWLDG